MFFRISLTLILISVPAFAQRGGGGGGGMSGMPMNLTNRLETITQILQLNKDQKKFVKTTFDQAQKEAALVRDQLLKSHEEIGAAVQSGRSPEELAGLISSHTALEAQMTQIEMKAFASVFRRLEQIQQGNARSLFLMMRGMFSEKNWNALQ